MFYRGRFYTQPYAHRPHRAGGKPCFKIELLIYSVNLIVCLQIQFFYCAELFPPIILHLNDTRRI